MNKGILRIAHSTFHFIIDNSFIFQFGWRIIPFLELESVTLLAEVEGVKSREECHFKVNWEQIVEVLLISGWKRIHGEVTASPSIHIGVQASLNHVEKGVPHGVLRGTTGCQMLQYVRFSSMIIRRSPKQNCKDIVHIWAIQMENTSSSCFMHKFVGIYIEEFNSLNRFQFKTMNYISDLKPSGIRYSVFASKDVFS